MDIKIEKALEDIRIYFEKNKLLKEKMEGEIKQSQSLVKKMHNLKENKKETNINRGLNRCPYCEQDHCIPTVAYANIENYGSNIFHLRCRHCEKMIIVFGVRSVSCYVHGKSDKDCSDF